MDTSMETSYEYIDPFQLGTMPYWLHSFAAYKLDDIMVKQPFQITLQVEIIICNM